MIDSSLMFSMYAAIVMGESKSDFSYTLDSEHNALWDEIAAEIAATPDVPGMQWYIPHEIPDIDEGVYTSSVEKHGEPGRDSDYARKHPEGSGGSGNGISLVDNPTYTILGGGLFSGKSTLVKAGFAGDLSNVVSVNPDDVKKQLPEHKERIASGDKTAAAFVHAESLYVAKRINKAAMESRLNIILDGTGGSSAESLIKKIKGAQAMGYTVNGVYATISISEALRRAGLRAEKSGCFVPSAVIRETHVAVSRVFPEAAPMFDSVKLYDNNDTMRLIFEGGRAN